MADHVRKAVRESAPARTGKGQCEARYPHPRGGTVRCEQESAHPDAHTNHAYRWESAPIASPPEAARCGVDSGEREYWAEHAPETLQYMKPWIAQFGGFAMTLWMVANALLRENEALRGN